MADIPDAELLEQFIRNQSGPAFATLVERHIHLVHSVARRHTTSPQQAEDITQAVFVILARKAAGLNRKVVLSGWLYHTARLTAANFARTEQRRVRREQEAFMQSAFQETASETVWTELSPRLDDAMSRLAGRDRDALVLRYFENKSLAEVGAGLGLEERTAQKRVSRALEKLRKIFGKRGVTLTATLIAGAVSANSVQAAPVGLAKTISAVAMAKGAAAGTSTLTLTKGALKVMAWTKTKTAIITGVVMLLAVGTTTITFKEIQAHKTYPWEVPEASFGVFYKMPAAIKIVPTKFSKDGNWCEDSSRGAMGIAQPLQAIIEVAYQMDKLHTIVAVELPTNRYDFFAKLVGPQLPHKNLPINRNWAIELQKQIAKQFGIVGQVEMRATEVLALKPVSTGTRGFKVSHKMPNGLALKPDPGNYSFYEQPVGVLSGLLQQRFQIPIVNQFGLTGTYDFSLKWDEPDPKHPNLDGLKRALRDQLGLELVPTNMPIKMLVVEKAK